MHLRRMAALLTVLALVAGACGDRGEDDGAVDDTTTTEPTDDSPEDPGSDGPGPGDFGSLTEVCGPQEEGGEVPDAGPEETQGITADSIEIGTVADPGFTGRLGLNQEIFDAAEAFVEWCNAAGGINGKELVLNLHDAAISNYQPVVEQACASDFALVGAGAVQDNLWPDVGAACGLIDIAGFSVTPQKSGVVGQDLIALRSVQAIPNPGDRYPVGAIKLLDEEFPDAVDATGFLYADFQSIFAAYQKARDGAEAIGHTVVEAGTYALLGESNWQAIAVRLQNAGVEHFSFVGEGENLALLQRAMVEIDYRPTVTIQETNFYDAEYLAAASEAAEGTFIRTAIWPFEEADANPATQQYLDIVEAVDGKVAILGVQSMSAWLLFAQAVKECDVANDLTRSCVLETAASVSEWDGGGLHAPTSPTTNEGSACVIVLRVEGGEFVRHAPDEDYHCDPDDVVTVPFGG
jgi:ABC-type branched-subunit amino acid transport system substrate-binding protein